MGSNVSQSEGMIIDVLPLNKNTSHRLRFIDETIDSFTLIWLDIQSKGNDLDSLRTKRLLLEINQKCLFYDDCQLFFHDIDQMKFENKKVLLIVSGSFIELVLSRSGIKTIISMIIIFCRHYYKYAKLKEDGIVDICTDHRSLQNCIQRELPSLKLNLFENQPLKSLLSFTENTLNDRISFTYILFIELLKQMPQTKQVREIMLNKCKDYYRDNKFRLLEINNFHQTYKSNQALKWYTQDSFIYRLVNRAFRTEDITLWYIFRYYIIDLCLQLEDIHRQQVTKFGHRSLRLFRGQAQMLTTELDDIQSRIGNLIVTTGFLSTSFESNVANMFASSAPQSETFKAVLYEIILDTEIAKNVIFVDVLDYLSSQNEAADMHIEEREILFNIGSVFRIENVHYESSTNLWHIKMEATDRDFNQIKLVKNKFQHGNQNLLFGRLLLDSDHYEEANSYFQLMIKVLPKSHQDLGTVYDAIGNLNMRITNWNEALKNFHQAYEIKKKFYEKNHPELGITLNNLGNYYKAIEENNRALNLYHQSLECINNNRLNIAVTKLNIGTILKINHQYLQALENCHEAFSILQQIEPCMHIELITCQGSIGDIHYAKEEYEIAEVFYLSAFNMAKKHVFFGDRCLIHCINALADTYEQQDSADRQRASEFCNEQLILHKKYLPENHVSIAYILMKLGQLLDKIDFYLEAFYIFERNLYREYASTAKCSILIAQCYDKHKMYEEALSFYTKAYQIQTKIYPKNHSIINGTEQLLTIVEKRFKEQLSFQQTNQS
ncbi:hypothetical protein I4U23_012322 [Adineta vaga]|nr:hypothetical protein I4U23_012322 [Adineta vaga]